MPSNEGSPLNIVQFLMVTNDQGWAIGIDHGNQSGRLYKINDSGKHWTDITVHIGQEASPQLGFFWDQETAFVFSSTSLPTAPQKEFIPYRTKDGGTTWQKGENLSVNYGTAFYPVQVYFLDRNHGWLLININLGHQLEGTFSLFATSDGGLHWDPVYSGLNQAHKSMDLAVWWPVIYPFQSGYLVFENIKTGFFPGRINRYESGITLYVTENGGKNWTPQPVVRPTDLPSSINPCCHYLESVPQFWSQNDGVHILQVYKDLPVGLVTLGQWNYQVPEVTYLEYTNDGGKSWKRTIAPAKTGAVIFLNESTDWFFGKDNLEESMPTQLFQTLDSGRTWTLINQNTSIPLGSQIHFLDTMHGFALNTYSRWLNEDYFDLYGRKNTNVYLFSTNDGGIKWEKVDFEIILGIQ